MKFFEWIGKSPDKLFGFENPNKAPDVALKYEEHPIEGLQIETCLDEIINLGNIGTKSPVKDFGNTVTYGPKNQVGSLKIEFSPLGSCRITILRLIKDLEGELKWITRYAVPVINDYEHLTAQDIAIEKMLAIRANEIASFIDSTSLERPRNDYVDLRNLVVKIASNMKLKHPQILNYEGVMETDINNYIIYFSYKGFGQGAPDHKKVNQFNIYLSYDIKVGLIHTWGAELSSANQGYEFRPQSPEWDEWFSPDQDPQEMVTILEKMFLTY